MRLALTSDLHGQLPEIPECDLLLIAGDVCPVENHNLDFQTEWLRYRFIPWLRRTPARQRIFIAGNHDFVFAEAPEKLRGLDWPAIYLQDAAHEWEGLRFWGTPWANELPGWPFCLPEYRLVDIWRRIPSDTQILLVHGPPLGIGDQIIGNISGDPLHVGSLSLRERLAQLSSLKLVVFGHIHEGSGLYEYCDVPLVNASLLNERYQAVNPVRLHDL